MSLYIERNRKWLAGAADELANLQQAGLEKEVGTGSTATMYSLDFPTIGGVALGVKIPNTGIDTTRKRFENELIAASLLSELSAKDDLSDLLPGFTAKIAIGTLEVLVTEDVSKRGALSVEPARSSDDVFRRLEPISRDFGGFHKLFHEPNIESGLYRIGGKDTQKTPAYKLLDLASSPFQQQVTSRQGIFFDRAVEYQAIVNEYMRDFTLDIPEDSLLGQAIIGKFSSYKPAGEMR